MKQKFFSAFHWLLIKKSGWRFKNKIFRFIWNKLWNFSIKSYKGTIDFKLHGEWIKMKNGYPYPLYINTFYKYNHPLIETVSKIFDAKRRPIDYIEVGGAIGDTMLLIFRTCPGMINRYYCIDGDKEFFDFQKHNLRNHTNGILVNCLLSDHETSTEKSLVRTHLGTASAQGEENVEALPLDTLVLNRYPAENIDLIKIDVDGMDGKVLAGSIQILKFFKPVIIFEWHPLLYHKTNNNITQPFNILLEQGYMNFLFYDKFGNFNHYQHIINNNELQFLNHLCLRNKFMEDWHFDVVAFNMDAVSLDVIEMAEMQYSSKF